MPEGLIREAEERAAELYGADRSYYLVNGSTCGLLAAICAAARRGDKVLAARNCHKAVYHAVSMQGLAAEFLYPAITRGDLQGQITAAQVEEALTKHPDIAVVILTSPTYEGIVSDVAAIAACCHAHGAALIVDEAQRGPLRIRSRIPGKCGAPWGGRRDYESAQDAAVVYTDGAFAL